MRSTLIHYVQGERTFAAVLERGDEVVAALDDLVRASNLSNARFSAIGALNHAVVGFFDPPSKDYLRTSVDEQVEVLSLLGNVALFEGRPKIHAHVVLGRRDGTTLGGHLLEAHVHPTLEVMLVESPRYLQRHFDAETGLALLDFR